MFYVNTYVSCLPEQPQIGISEVDLVYRNVSFGPVDLPKFLKILRFHRKLEISGIFFFLNKRSDNSRPHLHMKTTISWKGPENDTET